MNYLTFKRPRIPCDLAIRFCPVSMPCFVCTDFFNSYPYWKRAYLTLGALWRKL